MHKLSELEKSLISETLKAAQSRRELLDAIVNVPFKTMAPMHYDIGTIVLLIKNDDAGIIERVALSSTASAEGAVQASAVPFEQINIPIQHKQSAHVRALESMLPVIVTDWHDMFRPVLSAQQARDNQNGAGISTSVVQPFADEISGTIIFSLYVDPQDISKDAKEFFEWYAELVGSALSTENWHH